MVAYEFMPFDVNVDNLDAALAVVEGAGAKNGGLVIDTWHMSKLGIAPDDLKRIPLEYLTWVELSDGKLEWMEDHIEETTRFRKLPGEGEFDIRGYIRAAREMGYDDAWGIEVLSDELRGRADRRDVPARVRGDHVAVPAGRGLADRASSQPKTKRALDGEGALDLLRTMWRIRLFEERVGQLKRADEVHGLIHLSVGQEAVAAGVCGQLRDDDARLLGPPRARPRDRQGARRSTG